MRQSARCIMHMLCLLWNVNWVYGEYGNSENSNKIQLEQCNIFRSLSRMDRNTPVHLYLLCVYPPRFNLSSEWDIRWTYKEHW